MLTWKRAEAVAGMGAYPPLPPRLRGQAGLLVGLFVPVIGTLAGIGLVLYFVGAVVTVLRARSYATVAYPLLYLVPVVAALVQSPGCGCPSRTALVCLAVREEPEVEVWGVVNAFERAFPCPGTPSSPGRCRAPAAWREFSASPGFMTAPKGW